MTQPWATLVAIGENRIETRSWPTKHRGPLAIHAAKGFPADARALCRESPFRKVLARHGYADAADLPTGAVIALVCLDDVLEFGDSTVITNHKSVSKPPRLVTIGGTIECLCTQT